MNSCKNHNYKVGDKLICKVNNNKFVFGAEYKIIRHSFDYVNIIDVFLLDGMRKYFNVVEMRKYFETRIDRYKRLCNIFI